MLPSLQPQPDTTRLSLVGRGPTNASPGTQTSASSTHSAPTVIEDEASEERDAGTSKRSKKDKKGHVRLRYTTRPAVADVTEMTSQTKVTSHAGSVSSASTDQSSSKAVVQPMTISVPIPKEKPVKKDEEAPASTAKQEKEGGEGKEGGAVSKKESWLPGIARKDLSLKGREGTVVKDTFANFALARKIYESKLDLSRGRRSSGEALCKDTGVLVKAKRSRSVDVLPQGEKAPRKSTSRTKDGFMRVKVMSVDNLITEPSMSKELGFSGWRNRFGSLPKITSPPPAWEDFSQVEAGKEASGGRVLLFMPQEGLGEMNRRQTTVADEGVTVERDRRVILQNGMRKGSEASADNAAQTSDSIGDTAKQQKNFIPRPQRSKTMAIKMSQKNKSNTIHNSNTNNASSDATKLTDTIGIRGKTITDSATFNLSHDNSGDTLASTPKTKQDISLTSDDTPSPNPPGPFMQTPKPKPGQWIQAKHSKRQNTFYRCPSTDHGPQVLQTGVSGAKKGEAVVTRLSAEDGNLLSSLVVKGGALDSEVTAAGLSCTARV